MPALQVRHFRACRASQPPWRPSPRRLIPGVGFYESSPVRSLKSPHSTWCQVPASSNARLNPKSFFLPKLAPFRSLSLAPPQLFPTDLASPLRNSSALSPLIFVKSSTPTPSFSCLPFPRVSTQKDARGNSLCFSISFRSAPTPLSSASSHFPRHGSCLSNHYFLPGPPTWFSCFGSRPLPVGYHPKHIFKNINRIISLTSFNPFNGFPLFFFLNTLFKFFQRWDVTVWNIQNTYMPLWIFNMCIKSSPDQDEEHYPYPRELTYAPSQSIPPKGNCLFSPVTTN